VGSEMCIRDRVKAGDMLCIDRDARVGRLVFWKEKVAPRSTAPQPQLIPIQAAKPAGDGNRAAEVTSFTKARGVGNDK